MSSKVVLNKPKSVRNNNNNDHDNNIFSLNKNNDNTLLTIKKSIQNQPHLV